MQDLWTEPYYGLYLGPCCPWAATDCYQVAPGAGTESRSNSSYRLLVDIWRQ